MTRSQLAPGVEVVAVPGDRLALRTADGAFLRVETGEADVADLLARLAGTGPGATADADAEPELARLLEAFEAAGYLTSRADVPPPPRAWPAHRREVLLLGDAALTEPLAACLTTAGAAPRTGTRAELGTTRAAAVVWCLNGPVPEGLWDDADELPARGIAWLRCHREGHQLWLEPPAAAPGDVTSAQVRARRLAATPAYRELAAYWSGHRTTGAPVTLTAPAAACAAALLAADLTAWATGTTAPQPTGTLPAARRLRSLDVRTLTVSEHPVLPVPPVAAPLTAPSGERT
ncbi:hypothetical protein JJV70_00685 [Streptomyces sp. JJ66]|uniref:hypothetical protein n=1 Tax=Streptomyces sp. JJ66 TaxID=2803843 RepID=UPI001C56AF23|nr:hypothetical protein [Streptomyces sp. JJ66]MBW1600644.1 hypothetical protein [Streptomyces sp. JJ66]